MSAVLREKINRELGEVVQVFDNLSKRGDIDAQTIEAYRRATQHLQNAAYFLYLMRLEEADRRLPSIKEKVRNE